MKFMPSRRAVKNFKMQILFQCSQRISSMSETRNVTIIGETGCGKFFLIHHFVLKICYDTIGKSTLINYLTNFFLGGTPEKPKIAIPNKYFTQTTEDFAHDENSMSDHSKSKTAEYHEYKFVWDDEEFCFIDTPGISATNGLEQDKRNIEKITQMILKVNKLNAVILILNGTQARITGSVRNVLQQLHQMLPNEVIDNMIIILTYCNSYSVNFDPTQAKFPEHSKIFYMQNSAFSSPPEGRKTEQKRHIEEAWETSLETIKEILQTV
jgi:predicted GTPase